MSYLKQGALKAKLFERGIAWLDTGTPAGLHAASSFVEAVQVRQGFYIACLEEIAYRKGFINIDTLEERGNTLKNSDYGKYLLTVAADERASG
jgi:glucose-1-phosphate thymidylyltransferase